MIFLKIFLSPFSFLYLLVTSIRNRFYELGWFQQSSMPVAIVCAGNLKAGGTGKTPFISFLLEHFAVRYKTAVLSRGYGRRTKGFILASETDTAATIGDEPMQCYLNAHQRYHVAVCEDRTEGVRQLMQQIPGLQLVLLDDGFQHRRLGRDLDILLTEYADPFFNDYVLPSGRLRESRSGAARAKAVVVTKCPAVTDKTLFTSAIERYTNASVFYSSIRYGILKNNMSEKKLLPGDEVILLSGIANPRPLQQYIQEQAQLVYRTEYKDHYTYTLTDLVKAEQIRATYAHGIVVVTEKDWVKIAPLILTQPEQYLHWYYLPVTIQINEQQQHLLTLVDTAITTRLSAAKNT